jgi:hypothetical protein
LKIRPERVLGILFVPFFEERSAVIAAAVR